MKFYRFLHKIQGRYKIHQRNQAAKFLSPVRRIERLAPPSLGRFVAMTFDDGPTVLPTNPTRSDRGLTEHILNILKKHHARGTFNVIGSLETNKDTHLHMTGAKYLPNLIQRMVDEEHEISNHSFSHILFGNGRLATGNQTSHPNFKAVLKDLKQLHALVQDDHHYTIRLSRPPQYVDQIKGGYSSFDAFRYMDYQYLASSFDGGGSTSSGTYEKDVFDMVRPMKKALELDEESLNGHIIFQKDGYNTSQHSPIADALGKQLDMLTLNRYHVVTVSDLLYLSPFEDIGDNDPVHEVATTLINAGFCIAHKNNNLYPDKSVTWGEFITMTSHPQELLQEYRKWVDSGFQVRNEYQSIVNAYQIKPEHPYFHSFVLAIRNRILSHANSEKITADTVLNSHSYNRLIPRLSSKPMNRLHLNHALTKRDILFQLAEILL